MLFQKHLLFSAFRMHCSCSRTQLQIPPRRTSRKCRCSKFISLTDTGEAGAAGQDAPGHVAVELKADQEDVRPDTDIVMAAEDVMAVHTRLDDATLDAAQLMEAGHTGPTGLEVTEARSRPEPEPVADLTQDVEEDTAEDPPNKPDTLDTTKHLLNPTRESHFTCRTQHQIFIETSRPFA
ncbi:hypothetical protein EB796_020196 [Bugula neritina]|uniref:Uncharacterized protein n=1 Tax=Bugula neritina TaxID=10212 RepID=A0A7J7J6W9_BUGNE|nr:hypothetical protein EB796_020196 [Bugula neritina]